MGAGALAYVALTVVLATRVLAPIARLSNQWDTTMGGVLADAIRTNAVVKAFGGEAREEALLARVVAKWRRRTLRTWMAFTWAGSGQLALLWLIRIVATGAALWLWSRGQASAGDMAYVVTSYLVLNGYLRDIGQYVHQLQRAVAEMEELVALHDEPPGVADRADARAIAITAGAIRFEDVTFRYAGQDRRSTRICPSPFRPGSASGWSGRRDRARPASSRLIQRLYDVDGGRVTIDGQDVASATQGSLRRQVAVVPQEPVLFHRTLAEDHRLWSPRRDAGGDRAGRPARQRARFHRRPAEGLSHAGRRARREAVRRRTPAGGDRARLSGRCADPDPRRGDLQPRFQRGRRSGCRRWGG